MNTAHQPSLVHPSRPCSRREFLARTMLAASALAASGRPTLAAPGAQPAACPIVVFSKVYQELKLDFAAAAEVTAEAGLDGIDCPVRPGGEILPERAAEDLPRYVEVLHQHQLQMPLLTTAIASVSTPHAETLVRLAGKLGVRYYRLGFLNRQQDVPLARQAAEVRDQLKDLAALNQEVGLGALLQNHSSSDRTSYFGGNLEDFVQTLQGLDPARIGLAFDIGHALVVHGDAWRQYFEQLKPYFKIAYVKDVKRTGGWVPFGTGDLAGTGYFKLLREMGYHAPVSLHLEFNWSNSGKSKDRATLIKALKESGAVVRRWLSP